MARNKTKKITTIVVRRPRKRNNRRRRNRRSNKGSSGLMPAICSQIDPFCNASQGTKIYDDNSAPTIPFCVRSVINVVSDANGLLGLAISPRLNGGYATATITDPGTGYQTTSWNQFNYPNYTDFTTMFSEYRVVNFGVKLVNTTNLLSAAGSVLMGAVPAYTPGVIPFASSSWSREIVLSPLTTLNETFIGKPLDVTYKNFVPINTADSSLVPWTTLVVLAQGLPASTGTMTLELVINVEFKPYATGFMSLMATAPAPNVVAIGEAASAVRDNIPSISNTNTYSSSIEQKAMAFASGTAAAVNIGNNVATGFNNLLRIKNLLGSAAAVGGAIVTRNPRFAMQQMRAIGY